MVMPVTKTEPRKRPGRKPIITNQRKQLILDFIHEYRRRHEISPSIEEITEAIGYKNTSEGQVHTYVNQLIKEGWLKKAAKAVSRSLVPLKPHDAVYAKVTDEKLLPIRKRILRRL